ncbi:ubiquitin related modifier 1 [Coprinellus micaceus]|uniref:Ubiquitin-related modifier 1 n=1 Tax=Coprinellus micaceus TaxID=71717 RepID=A0A4Y7SUM7_COPMI|nr:ubiquitin related modifier 1 [Coprinellus micaceus]
MESTISIKVEFSGGLELLFDNKRSHELALPAVVPLNNDTKKDVVVAEGQGKPADVAYLIAYLRDHLLQERAELFEEGGTVRPGILVLVNDTDWELEGEGEYALRDGDEIVFISTLHGG